MTRDIAIIGMGCRFPNAGSPQQLWESILASRASFKPVPAWRWAHGRFQGSGRDPYMTLVERGAFLEDLEMFAASYFGVAPRRAQVMDPQQRLVLETAREALCDAGLEGRPYDRERSGVFVGASVSEYSRLMITGIRARQLEEGQFGQAGPGIAMTSRIVPIRPFTLPGSLLSMAAGIVAHHFDLQGPSLSMDAACASSLFSVVNAVHYLRGLPDPSAGEAAPIALAGGVYANVVPDNLLGFSRLGAMARHDCRPFDRQASGFLMGEGVGMVVLKRASQAIADGDRIYAIIKGVAWNSDGRSDNPVSPSMEGQMRVMKYGFADAGLPPAHIGYAECHGTATTVGDRVEIAALSRIYQDRELPLRLGSIKANIGHAMSASGVAGLFRAVLAVYNATFPPQANWDCWHPDLEPYQEQFHIDTEPVPWDQPVRHAAVSSFGFGGHNAFAILAQAPPGPPDPGGGPYLFRASAPTPGLLKTYLEAIRPCLDRGSLAGAAYTLGLRQPSKYQALFAASALDEATARLELAVAAVRQGAPGSDIWWGPTESAPAGAGADLPQAGPIVDIPPMPLERQAFWAVEPGD